MGNGAIDRNLKFNDVLTISEVRDGLERIFPSGEGWKVFNRYNWVSYIYNFIVQRTVKDGSTQRILIEVNTEGNIRKTDLQKINKMAENLSSENSHVIKKILISTKELKLSLPNNIEFFSMKDFRDQFNEVKSGLLKRASA